MNQSFSFDPEEVKKVEDRLSKRLKSMLLLLYSLEVDKKTLIVLGHKILEEEFNKIIKQINVETSANGFISITEQSLKKHLERVFTDWVKVVEDTVIPPESGEPEKEIVNRAALISWYLVWTMFSQAILEVAKNEEVIFLEWVILENPPTPVCPTCISLAGLYDLETYIPELPNHPLCRCRWRLWFITPVIDNRPVTRKLIVGDLYKYSQGAGSAP